MKYRCKDCDSQIIIYDDGVEDSDGFGECEGCFRLFESPSDFRIHAYLGS